MKNNYAKAYKEIVEILKYVPDKDINKIPENMRNMFETEMDKEYEFQIDIQKPFEEQKLLEETKAILANIFRDYWATDKQKEKIIKIQNNQRQILEEQKRELYNPDKIFEKKEIVQEETALVEVKKEKFYEKIINFLKKILKI